MAMNQVPWSSEEAMEPSTYAADEQSYMQNVVYVERDNWGPARFLDSRNHRQPVLIYQSRINPARCYTFFHQRHHKTTGYSTFACMDCFKLRKKESATWKIPSVTVGEGYILIDPEAPINAYHKCHGRLTKDVVIERSRLEMLGMAGDVNITEEEIVNRLSAVTDDPHYLSLLTTNKDKELFRQTMGDSKKKMITSVRKARKRAAVVNETFGARIQWKLRKCGEGLKENHEEEEERPPCLVDERENGPGELDDQNGTIDPFPLQLHKLEGEETEPSITYPDGIYEADDGSQWIILNGEDEWNYSIPEGTGLITGFFHPVQTYIDNGLIDDTIDNEELLETILEEDYSHS
ncbi:hypothetical protein PFISCL1PPCAC_2096 [Pristionchus fissidentatus]|uniref:Uncharacterized protein n=1 Tax=Pristionchus fissidentatus TaxID=1538716 RepID=A0AAV5UWT3_9BILA|nr:hypothetical protein PFISCL1PPCAC_2096 [Pristionchus fissidentatus]